MTDEEFVNSLAEVGIALTPVQLAAFNRFEENLYAANATRNLTRVSRDECRLRHFVDSLLFCDLIPNGTRVLDIGSGPGFPAWPIACARPDLKAIVLDSSSKMLDFLRENLLPNLEIVQGRAEDRPAIGTFDVVTGRALAPLPIQLELSARFVKVGGAVIPMRTHDDKAEIERMIENPLGLELERVVERALPVLNAPRVFPIFRKVSTTPKTYPRAWSQIRAQPL